MAHEINLVPDIKGEMIKTLKLRNFIFFLCIVVASASAAVSLIFFSIVGGQKAILNGKKDTLGELSNKINSYTDLDDFLTIKDQLGNLSTIAENQNLLSRSFGVLSAILPTSGDSITISKLNISLDGESPAFALEAQADAKNAPYIDYNVLDSFKKSMQYMRYDYGDYVDREGNVIPAYCMIENDADGVNFYDPEKGRYAYWTYDEEGCLVKTETEEESTDGSDESDNAAKPQESKIAEASVEAYEGIPVIRIWRTPQFNAWYSENAPESGAYMDLNGNISGIEHFESKCITYAGTQKGNSIVWTDTNDSCLLVPEGTDGIAITESSNGRDSSDELVLRFNATITFAPEYFKFANKHMIAIGPTKRYNVTDSYVQVQNMFSKRAADCAKDDLTCNNTIKEQ